MVSDKEGASVMSIKQDYDFYLKRREHVAASALASVWQDQEERYVPPFRLYGPVWFVGDSWVCVHLIDTGDGLLLIDSGNCGATAMLIQSIWEAGFNPRDVKWIIHSHGHVDHIGGSAFFKKMFGTKLYLGEPDAKMFREHPEISLIQDSSDCQDELFVPDYEIKEGDVHTFGNITMQFSLVPGHTDGCIALFFDVDGPEGIQRCGYYGGFGFNTLTREYLTEIGDTQLHTRQVYLDSLAKVRDQKVDIFLGNHSENNQTLERRQRQIENPDGPNPFIDPDQWKAYLDQKHQALLEFIADEHL